MPSLLLLDENLPAKLISVLSGFGLNATHVSYEGFTSTSDLAIWDFALANGAIIVTKDSDYRDLAAITGRGRVILLAIGNMRLQELCDYVGSKAEAVLEFANGQERVLILNRPN